MYWKFKKICKMLNISFLVIIWVSYVDDWVEVLKYWSKLKKFYLFDVFFFILIFV